VPAWASGGHSCKVRALGRASILYEGLAGRVWRVGSCPMGVRKLHWACGALEFREASTEPIEGRVTMVHVPPLADHPASSRDSLTVRRLRRIRRLAPMIGAGLSTAAMVVPQPSRPDNVMDQFASGLGALGIRLLPFFLGLAIALLATVSIWLRTRYGGLIPYPDRNLFTGRKGARSGLSTDRSSNPSP
jgi:hypothetical protein